MKADELHPTFVLEMSLVLIIMWLLAVGAIGGLVNCILGGGFPLPHLDKKSKVWRPGWLGNVLLSMVAAVVWGMSNLTTFYEFPARTPADLRLTPALLLGSLLAGVGGAHFLKGKTQKALFERGQDAKHQG